MKLVDYLARRKRYKELRRQLRVAKDELSTTLTTYGVYGGTWDMTTIQIAIERMTKQEKEIEDLKKELREIFKE